MTTFTVCRGKMRNALHKFVCSGVAPEVSGVQIPPCLTFVPTFSAESVGCYNTLFKEYQKAKARLHLVRDKQNQGMCQAGGSCSLSVTPYWPALHRAGNAQEVKGMSKHMQISQQNYKPLLIVSKSTFTYLAID